MPRNQVSPQELKVFVENLKNEIFEDTRSYLINSNTYANLYLNKVLDKLAEYRY
jgi:hypothetical protein